jgi:hypothetical protein
MSALPIDYISARGSRMVISPVGSRNKLELKLRQVRALQGPMIEGEFYNQTTDWSSAPTRRPAQTECLRTKGHMKSWICNE